MSRKSKLPELFGYCACSIPFVFFSFQHSLRNVHLRAASDTCKNGHPRGYGGRVHLANSSNTSRSFRRWNFYVLEEHHPPYSLERKPQRSTQKRHDYDCQGLGSAIKLAMPILLSKGRDKDPSPNQDEQKPSYTDRRSAFRP